MGGFEGKERKGLADGRWEFYRLAQGRWKGGFPLGVIYPGLNFDIYQSMKNDDDFTRANDPCLRQGKGSDFVRFCAATKGQYAARFFCSCIYDVTKREVKMPRHA
jgi:hypothetical protein